MGLVLAPPPELLMEGSSDPSGSLGSDPHQAHTTGDAQLQGPAQTQLPSDRARMTCSSAQSRGRSYRPLGSCKRPPLPLGSCKRPPLPLRSCKRPLLAMRSCKHPLLPLGSCKCPPLPLRPCKRPPLPLRSCKRPLLPLRSCKRPPLPLRSWAAGGCWLSVSPCVVWAID